MAIQLRLLGTVTDAVRRLTYTPSGKPRFTFGVRVGTIRTRHYLVTAYGTTAKFADLFLRTGQRIRIEGAFLRRVPAFEGAVRGDTIRHVGGATPPMNGTLVRFVPRPPPRASSARRPMPHANDERRETAAAALNEAIEAVPVFEGPGAVLTTPPMHAGQARTAAARVGILGASAGSERAIRQQDTATKATVDAAIAAAVS